MSRSRASCDLGGLDRRELDLAHHPARLARFDLARAEAPRGLRAAGHAEAQAMIGGAAFVARSQVPGEEGVARATFGDRLTRLDAGPLQARLAVDEHLREAAVGERHDRLARAQRGDLAHRERALVLAGELVPDELL